MMADLRGMVSEWSDEVDAGEMSSRRFGDMKGGENEGAWRDVISAS